MYCYIHFILLYKNSIKFFKILLNYMKNHKVKKNILLSSFSLKKNLYSKKKKPNNLILKLKNLQNKKKIF
jgi:hypothetical protein